MAYIARDANGKIISLSANKRSDDDELMAMDNIELIEFLAQCDHEKKLNLIQSDLQFIRVIEDLIDILLAKKVIAISDFPEAVIEKVVLRHGIRKYLCDASGMEFDNEL